MIDKKGFIFPGVTIFFIGLMVLAAGCLGWGDEKVDLIQTGSSTVLPLATLWAEEFDGANIALSGGGSSHGMEALLKGEADLADSSRLLKGSDYEVVGGSKDDVNPDGTAKKAAPTGVWPYKWIVAYDMLAVIVNDDNIWTSRLNYSQLYLIFTDDDPAVYWDDTRLDLPGAPHERIEIYAPDEASGTYDYFFESIIKDWKKDGQVADTRLDSGDGVYHPSADDNVILKAVKENEYAIGYFGFAYLVENPGTVKAVEIARTSTYVRPSFEDVGSYPMARPLHIYTDGIPDNGTAKGKAIYDYIEFILSDEGQDMVPDVGYIKVEAVDPSVRTDQLDALRD